MPGVTIIRVKGDRLQVLVALAAFHQKNDLLVETRASTQRQRRARCCRRASPGKSVCEQHPAQDDQQGNGDGHACAEPAPVRAAWPSLKRLNWLLKRAGKRYMLLLHLRKTAPYAL